MSGRPGEREGAEGVSGAGRGAEEGEGGLGAGVGLPAAGLVDAGDGLMAAEVNAFTGFGAVGGPRGLGDTGGGTRCLGSVQEKEYWVVLVLLDWTFLCWSVRGQLCSRLTWTLRRLRSVRPGDGDPAGRRWGVGLGLPQVDGGRFGRHRGLQRLPGLHPLAGLLAELRPLGGLGHGPPPQDHAAVLLRLSAGVRLLVAVIRLLGRARFPAYGV